MKKILITFLIALSLICAFTVCVFAEEGTTEEYYIVQEYNSELATSLAEQGKNVVSIADLYYKGEDSFFYQFADGANVVMNFAENIAYTPIMTDVKNNDPVLSTALIHINSPITVTFKFNGYSWWITQGSSYYCGFRIENTGANVRFIGSHAGKATKQTVTPSKNEQTNDIDWYGDYVPIYLMAGNIYMENLRAFSRDEFIYQNASGQNRVVCTHEFKNCSIDVSGSRVALGLEGGNTAPKIVKIDGGYYDGLAIHEPCAGTYIKNATIYGEHDSKGISGTFSLAVDSWSNYNSNDYVENPADIAAVEVTNSVIESNLRSVTDGVYYKIVNSELKAGFKLDGDSSGGALAVLIDCIWTYDSEKVDYGYRTGPVSTIIAITSATCDSSATKTVYKSSGAVADESYAEANPALGHIIDIENATGVVWENYFENGMYQGFCARCKADTNEQEGTAKPLFENKGLSHAEYQDTTKSMTQGFKVNTEMLVYLENGYDFGIVATVNKAGGEIAPALDGTGVVSASFAKAGFSIFHVKVTNIPEANKDTKIVFCAYLVNGGKTYYLNDGTTSETIVGLDYTTVSK